MLARISHVARHAAPRLRYFLACLYVRRSTQMAYVGTCDVYIKGTKRKMVILTFRKTDGHGELEATSGRMTKRYRTASSII